MDERVFGLKRPPFAATPDPDCFFPAPAAERALARIRRAAERDEGIALLISPPGCGKTLVCRRLLAELKGTFRAVLLPNPRFESPTALLQTILFELDQPYLRMSQQELRLRLVEYLSQPKRRAGEGNGLVLVVDEAQGLAPLLFEELRLLGEFTGSGRALVRLALAGGERLEEVLAQPELTAFEQRVCVRAYLEPFTRDETARYVDYRLRWAGADNDRLLLPEAVERVHRLSDGVPRTVNQIADQALLLAASRNVTPIPAELVDEAWSSMEQLGSQWSAVGTTAAGPSGGVVEFGTAGEEAWDWDERSAPPHAVGDTPGEPQEAVATSSSAASIETGQAVANRKDGAESIAPFNDLPARAASRPGPIEDEPSGPEENEQVVDSVALLDARRRSRLKPFVCEDPAEVFTPRRRRQAIVPFEVSLSPDEPFDLETLLAEVRDLGGSETHLDADARTATTEESFSQPEAGLPRSSAASQSAALDDDLIVVTDAVDKQETSAEVVAKPKYRQLIDKLRFG